MDVNEVSEPDSPIDLKNIPASGRSPRHPIWMRLGVWMLSGQVAWIALLLTLLMTFLVWKSTKEALLQAQQVQFENRASEVTNAVLKRIQGYEHVLRGGVGLFAASQSVSRTEWRDYVGSLRIQEQYPGIQGIGFSVYIPAARLNEHLRTIRAEGFPDYAIFPPGARREYTPVIYLEPFDWRNQRAFGFDMFSEANRRAAMERARDTGGTAISSKVTLVQETGKEVQAGMLMYLPYYKNGMPHNTLAERRANLVGYVYSPFRLNDLMSGIPGKKQAGAEPDIDLEIYDGRVRSVDSLLYDDDGIAHALGKPTPERLTLNRSMDLYGHTWSLHFTSRPAFHAAFDQNKPLHILLFGTLLSGMVSGLIWVFATQRRRALALASRMTEEIAERNRAEEALKERHEELQLAAMVYQNSSEAMTVTDSNGAIVSVNPAFTEVTGYTLEEVVGRNTSMLSSGRHDHAFYQAMWNEINTTGHWQGEIWNRRKNGELYLEWITINTIYHNDGSAHRYVSLFSDITKKKESEELIWQQANFDTLTGLPNRHMFYDRLEQAIKKSHRSGLPMALMLLDLDHFKEVNDTLGHAQGDVLLVEAARRIAEYVRESDTVARLGGDEFTVILSEVEDVNSVERIAQNIIERLAAPFQLLQETAFVSASVGITLYPNDAQNVDTLIKNADQAMYLAKNSGRGRFSYFTAALQEAAQTRMRLGKDLRNVLAAKQLAVYYQPIVEMASGKIYKAEALVRWQHPERGMVSPMQFIPLAEESGLIHEIGDWVFREAARQLKRWRERFVPEFQISVNVSPVQFRQNSVDDESSWTSHLRAMDLPGQSLAIEITEGLLLNAEINVTEKLLSFRDAGVQVALDDFGTGYSSLSYLKKFDIDYLKIDQSFVRNLEDDADDMALCEAIIVMAHKLGLKVIAEGVETERQRDLLAAYGCDYAQGFLYSKAVPSEQFEALLQERAK
jgi:diguanylate cyclase (GGDEF)-like protein/PAS domain S-box-containing protein